MSTSIRNRKWLLAGALFASLPAWAVAPAELGASMKRGDPVTIIDVRSTDVFTKGHIPGAINVPAAIVAEKRLPKLGKVVVYDDGLGTDKATAAAAELSKKPGIAAEVLQGGYSAWETANAADTTAGSGSHEESLPRITYKELKAMPGKNLLLVDLRQAADAGGKTPKSLANPNATPMTDLHATFPGAKITTSAFGPSPAAKSAADAVPLMVLIDNGDGTAETTARQLRANGQRRFIILAGGEQIIARDGVAGKQRLGSKVGGAVPMQALNSGQ